MANVQGALYVLIAAKQMRRLFDPCGGAGHHDVLGPAEVDVRRDKEDLSYEARAAYGTAGEKRGNLTKKPSSESELPGEAKGDGQMLNGFNRRKGERNRCFARDSEYHLAPKRPLRKSPTSSRPVPSPPLNKAPRPPYASISMETPVSARKDGSPTGR